MKTKTVLLIIVILLSASQLIAEDTKMITGREKRKQAKSAGSWDQWYSLTLPGMDDVLVESNKFSIDMGRGKQLVVNFDIYYPPFIDFKSKRPAVFVCRGRPQWMSAISFGQLLAVSGFIAVIPDMFSFGESFCACIEYCLKNAKAFGIDKKNIGIWGGGFLGSYAFDPAINKRKKYHKYIKCAVFENIFFPSIEINDKSRICKDVPMLFITSSFDYYRSIDGSFLESSKEMNIPIEYVEYQGSDPYWYKDDTDEALDCVMKELDFFTYYLHLE
jgi:hypothetical protein